MPTYRWKGQTGSGQLIEGKTTADSANDVIATLRAGGIGVIEISAGKGGEQLQTFGAAESNAVRTLATPPAPRPRLSIAEPSATLT